MSVPTEVIFVESNIYSGKERFINSGGECFVMERSKRVPTTALIFRPCNRLNPYIIAVGHKPGDTNWDSGKYYGSLFNAVKDFESWDKVDDDADK